MKQPRPKALISWSSGKDSAFALHEIRRAGEFDVVGALTTVTETFDRVSIHGVRQEILRAQLDAAGLPPRIVPIPYPCPNAIYEARMGEAVASAVREGITHIIFGHLFLEDIKAYREQKLNGTGITLCNLFQGWPRDRIAMIYGGDVQPSTEICDNYFELTGREIRRLGSADGAEPLRQSAALRSGAACLAVPAVPAAVLAHGVGHAGVAANRSARLP